MDGDFEQHEQRGRDDAAKLNYELRELREKISEHAKMLGFDLAGFTKPEIDTTQTAALKKWLNEGRNGGMYYLSDTKHIEARANMNLIFPGVASVVVVAMNYYHPQPPLKRGYARVARYAYGRDYHKIIGKKLRQLKRFIENIGADSLSSAKFSAGSLTGEKIRTKSFVDVGPILERAYAAQAGIGVIGKNSMLITKDYGSWVLIGEILTNLKLVYETTPSNAQKNTSSSPPFSSCGSCTRCMQACPTGAIIAPGVVDARLCISYLTIEHKGRVPEKLARIIKKTKRIFGCDICQEVCPHNSRQKVTAHNEFTVPAIATDALYVPSVKKINTESLFHRKFAGSAVKRAKRAGLKRNARICGG